MSGRDARDACGPWPSDDARRVLREAAANPDDQTALRSLLKEIRLLLDPEDNDDVDDLDGEKRRKSLTRFGQAPSHLTTVLPHPAPGKMRFA